MICGVVVFALGQRTECVGYIFSSSLALCVFGTIWLLGRLYSLLALRLCYIYRQLVESSLVALRALD